MASNTLTAEQLANVDAIVVIDHSGSTSEPSLIIKGKTRFDEQQEIVGTLAREAAKYDDDGLTVIAFSTRSNVFDGVTPERVNQVFKEFEPRGLTNLHLAINDAVAKARSSTKQTVVLIFTDGAATDATAVIKSITDAANEFGRPKIGFAIVQIGTDPDATKFLNDLDNNLKNAPDVVAVVPLEDAADLSYGELAWLAQNA